MGDTLEHFVNFSFGCFNGKEGERAYNGTVLGFRNVKRLNGDEHDLQFNTGNEGTRKERIYGRRNLQLPSQGGGA